MLLAAAVLSEIVLDAQGYNDFDLYVRAEAVRENETAATCTEAGLTDGVKYSACGEVLVPLQTIPATGKHVDEDGDGYCDSGCGTETGTPSQDPDVCKDCGKDRGKNFWQTIIFTGIFTAMFSAVC